MKKPAPTKPAQKSMTSAKPVNVASAATAGDLARPEPRPRVSLVEFFRQFPVLFNQVRAETRKITWPSRKETWITTVMVLLMVVIATVFFAVVDGLFNLLFHFMFKG